MLLTDGLNTNDDTTGRFVLLEMARDLAVANGDIETALRALEQTEVAYNVDSLAVKTEALNSLAGTVRTREQHSVMVSTLGPLVTEAIAADRYKLAKQLSTLALMSARKARDIAVLRQAVSQLSDVEALEKEYVTISPALTKLANAPANPDANLAVGRFLCFVKGDWESGIRMLALGSDQELKNLAEGELGAPSKPEEQLHLGDEWWTLAESQEGRPKRNLLIRARHWYSEAIPSLSGLSAARVRKRLDELEQSHRPRHKLPSGTVVAFDFEKSSITWHQGKQLLRDLTDHNSDGEIINAKVVRGVHGTALSFHGDGYVRFSDKELPKADTPRAILFWHKIDDTATNQVPFVFGADKEGDATYTIVCDESRQGRRDSVLKMSVGNPGGRNQQVGQTLVADGKWHHIALVYDGKGIAQLYVDGQIDLGFARNYQTSSPGHAYIGKFVGGHFLVGAVDDFIVLDRAVSGEEVIAIKNNGITAVRIKQ